jgi:hypothetical protein
MEGYAAGQFITTPAMHHEQSMKKLSRSFTLGVSIALICLSPLHAQNGRPTPADSNPTAAVPALPAQAPDEVTTKITGLVHDGKYGEAQQLTTGLLVAYPDDQRLIKAKALLDKLLAPADSAASGSNQPTSNVAPAQPATNTNTEQFTGMDKVEYNALIELARQAQQDTDLAEQKKLLQQFMNQSVVFLQQHPSQLLLQLRAASAISLNDPRAGYEAGQKLLAAGAADSNDLSLQRLLGQLKNKGWLERQEAERQAEKQLEYRSLLGTWNGHLSRANHKGNEIAHFDWIIDFAKVNSGIEGYVTTGNGKKEEKPTLRGSILESGEISWERRWGSDWTPVQVEMNNDHRVMKFAFTATININFNAFNTKGTPEQCTQTITLTKR